MLPKLSPTSAQAAPAYASDAGVAAHCRRVAALAVEIAGRLRLPADAMQLLERVALLHHYPAVLVEPEALDRLMIDLCGDGWRSSLDKAKAKAPQALPSDLRAVLKALGAPSASEEPDRETILAEIVEIANLFDEQLEFLPYEFKTVEQILDELRDRKSTRLNSSHSRASRMPSSA